MRIAFCSALLVFAAAVPMGCDQQRTDAVVMVVIDTMRGDRLGVAGYRSARTPHLDSLATSGVYFADAMTPVPVTLPAIASLMTGRLPFNNGVRDNIRVSHQELQRIGDDPGVLDRADSVAAFALRANETTLAERLHNAGWQTAAVVASAVLSADRGLSQGFDSYDADFGGTYPVYDESYRYNEGLYASTRRRADTVTDLAIERMQRFDGRPFFLFVHYFDVHASYDPPPAFARMHPDRPYDGEISFVDAEIGRLLAALRREQRRALVIVTSDHGEGLGEHGEPGHGFLLHRSTLHVPLIVSGPDVGSEQVRRDPVSLVDLEPTIAQWLGLPPTDLERDGRALSWDTPEQAETPLYAETMRTLLSYEWSELRGLRLGKWKLIAGPTDELYDLSVDALETNPVVDPQVEASLKATLETLTDHETREQILASTRDDPDPQRARILSSLGYVSGTIPTQAPRSYPHPKEALPGWLAYQEAKNLYLEGRAWIDGGSPRRALALFEQAVSRHSQFPQARFALAVTRLELGDSAGFWRDIEATHAIEPGHIPALFWLAQRHERRGHYDRALEKWKAILTSDDAAVVANPMRLIGEPPYQASVASHLVAMRRTVAQRPEDADAHLELGITLLRCGRKQDARASFERYLSISASDPTASETRRVIRAGGF